MDKQLFCDYLFQENCVSPEPGARQIQQPLNDDRNDLFAECIIRAAYRDTELDLRNLLRNIENAWNVRAHLYDLATKVVKAVRNFCSIVARGRSKLAQQINDFGERMLLVVPEHDTVVVLHHRICAWLETEICLISRYAGLVGRTVEGLQDKV